MLQRKQENAMFVQLLVICLKNVFDKTKTKRQKSFILVT